MLSGSRITHTATSIPFNLVKKCIASTESTMREIATGILFGGEILNSFNFISVSQSASGEYFQHEYSLLLTCPLNNPINEPLIQNPIPLGPLKHCCTWLCLYLVKCKYPAISIGRVIATPFVHRTGVWSVVFELYCVPQLDINISTLIEGNDMLELKSPVVQKVNSDPIQLESETLVVDDASLPLEEQVVSEQSDLSLQKDNIKDKRLSSDDTSKKRFKESDSETSSYKSDIPTGIDNVVGMQPRKTLKDFRGYSFVDLHSNIHNYNNEMILSTRRMKSRDCLRNSYNLTETTCIPTADDVNDDDNKSEQDLSDCDQINDSEEVISWDLLPVLTVFNELATSEDVDTCQVLNPSAASSLKSIFESNFNSTRKESNTCDPIQFCVAIHENAKRNALIILSSSGCLEEGSDVISQISFFQSYYSRLNLGSITFLDEVPKWLISQHGSTTNTIRYMNHESVKSSGRRVIQIEIPTLLEPFQIKQRSSLDIRQPSISFLCLKTWIKSPPSNRLSGDCVIFSSHHQHIKVWFRIENQNYKIVNIYMSDSTCTKEEGALVVVRSNSCNCVRMTTVGSDITITTSSYFSVRSHSVTSIHVTVDEYLIVLTSPEFNNCESKSVGCIAAAVAFFVKHDVRLPIEVQ